MADGSPEDRAGPDRTDDLTFSAADSSFRDSKQCTGGSSEPGRFRLSFYTELEPSDSYEISETRGVLADRPAAAATSDSRKTTGTSSDHGDDRKKRCFDRYDSSESSDSGVAVLSPTESSGCSGSDITEPRSPRSPESACSTSEEGVGTRMPPWASDPAPQGPRRLAAQPAPLRRPNPSIHRRITEYFNHKMKPQNSVKRDSNPSNGDTKKKCLSKNGVTHDLEKYISYLSKTLSPKLLDIGKQADATLKIHQSPNTPDSSKTDLNKITASTNINGLKESRFNDSQDINKLNGFMEVRHGIEAYNREKNSGAIFNGITDGTKQIMAQGPSSSVTANVNKPKVPIPASFDHGLRISPATSMNHQSPKKQAVKHDSTKLNGVVSSTTKLDSRMNGVTCGSNNLNLINKPSTLKKEPTRRKPQTSKRTNRKSSACIANSKNLTWSKANNLKQVQMQKQKCTNSIQVQLLNQNCTNSIHSPANSIPGEASTAPKMNIPNGVRQVSMTVNGSLGNMNVPVANLQNCHQINIPQRNGTVASNNLASFVAVPQNVMLTTLRIPQSGLPPQANLNLNQQGNITAFNSTNVNVSSPTKLNGQFVFPLMQNINGTVLQIPNLMAKMPNFVLPQNPQITTHRPDHLQNQQAAQILLNGTLLKLANTIPSTYTTANKSSPVTSQPMPAMNKNIPGLQAVGMTVQPKPNYGVNLSHPVLVPQSGFIVTSVPNINVKETWSYTNTSSVSTSQITCSNPLVHHPQAMMSNFSPQTLHSSISLARVKPPDNPIQGTEPPSSTVKEEIGELKNLKCDFPWLSKTVNNNIVPLDSNKISSRPFAQVSSCSGNVELSCKNKKEDKMYENNEEECKVQSTTDEIRKVEEVARREDTIFTQITVLKDVSSNVQNSVIEANFCSTTTESSESGIGTDKSIDSPSDSQASKECDEDSSSLSLSISVSSIEAQSCQKSPILKQPKILRFPPKSITKTQNGKRTSSTDTTGVTLCLWENCKRKFESDSDLLEHLQSTHVEPQVGVDQTNYVCLWEQCKVRGKPSCSRLWLERHVLSHGGNKPFKCIVDGCDRRFSKQTLLVRHVNNHFNEVSPNNANKKSTDSSSKLIRRNGKKLRYRRQPWSARMFDFFDTGMMEGLAWRLSRSTRWRLGGACPLREPPGRHTLTLHAALAATRYNVAEARREALLTYYPPHVIEDEWVPENEVKRVKRVEISELPVHTKVLLYEQFCSSYRKTPSPPPMRKAPVVTSQPVRLLPPRQCTSSRLLNNLIAKQRKERNDCSATNMPMEYNEDDGERVEVSGAKKRKMGRRYGGNSFMPCGR